MQVDHPTTVESVRRAASISNRPWVLATIGLGANLGDAQQTMQWATLQIENLPLSKLCKQSSVYGSAPVDSSGPDYFNAVVQLSTQLTAPALLSSLQAIEHAAGRERPYRNAPRTLDLDVLLFGNATISSPSLTVPHPRMWERAFVLVPLHEINPDLVTPQQLAIVQGQAIWRVAEQ